MAVVLSPDESLLEREVRAPDCILTSIKEPPGCGDMPQEAKDLHTIRCTDSNSGMHCIYEED